MRTWCSKYCKLSAAPSMSGTPYVACRRGATAPGRRASLRNVLRDVVGKNN